MIDTIKTDKYTDITSSWLKNKQYGHYNCNVIDAKYYVYNNIKYNVDKKNVILDYSKQERRIALWLCNTFGSNVYMMPRINYPNGIMTADYLFKNEYWDLKTIKGSVKRSIEDAIKKGAIAIVIEEGCDLKAFKVAEGITVVMTKDTREALAIIASNFYGNPSKKFKLVGITGTKGKTTTSFMTKAILEKQGYKVGLIGTIATYIGNKKLEDSDRTTPESNKLQKIFYKMAKEECDVVVMEVSSQSLKLNRVAGCDFDIGVFTNFSEDHISPKEHPDMQDYFNSKLKLLKMCKVGFTNADDLMVAKVPKLLPECNITTYGIDNYCNLLAKDITITNSI